MKGTPAMPQCGFSNIVCRVLDGYGACPQNCCSGDPSVTQSAIRRRQVREQERARGPRAAAGHQVVHGVAHHPAGVCRRRVRGALLVAVTSDASQCDSRAVCREAPTFSWACTTAASWRSCFRRSRLRPPSERYSSRTASCNNDVLNCDTKCSRRSKSTLAVCCALATRSWVAATC